MFLYFGWIIVLVVLCNVFLLECGFFFLFAFISKILAIIFLWFGCVFLDSLIFLFWDCWFCFMFLEICLFCYLID